MSDHMNMHETDEIDPLGKYDRARSNFVRELVNVLISWPACPQRTSLHRQTHNAVLDDLSRLPQDVRECMESWKNLEQFGFELEVFDESSRGIYSDLLGSEIRKSL
jgi:hypothetical protein